MVDYTARFMTNMEELEMKGVQLPEKGLLTAQYISSLGMNEAFDDLLKDFEKSTWYKRLSWKEIMIHCIGEVNEYCSIHEDHPNATKFRKLIEGTTTALASAPSLSPAPSPLPAPVSTPPRQV